MVMDNLVYVLPHKLNIETLPKEEEPYWIASKDGWYVWKRGLIGASVTPRKEGPKHIGSFDDYSGGILWYEAQKIPASIIGQAVDFFRQVYSTIKTEAEVLILFNDETKEYRLHVPDQECSFVSVESKYDPTEIETGWQVMGSIHSHCTFGAFHSSTDEKDASSFNGLHITIGAIDKEIPEFAVMASVDGVNFNFDIGRVADTEGFAEFAAPSAWLAFVKEEKYTYAVPATTTAVVHKGGPNVMDAALKAWNSYNSGKKNKKNKKPKEDRRGFKSVERFSSELGRLVPLEFWNGDHIADEHFEDALDYVLEKLMNVAAEHGRLLLWDISDLEVPNARADNSFSEASVLDARRREILSTIDDSDYYGRWDEPDWRRQALLPGPMEVRSNYE